MRQKEEWTREEVRTLKKFFKNKSNLFVSMILDRTPKAIERKAAKIGLRKSKKYLTLLAKFGK